MAPYSRLEVSEKIKRLMIEFTKRNSTTWKKNHPPYIKDELADLTLRLMADAWEAGRTVGQDVRGWSVPNPYRKDDS